ncbi:MAG: TIGR04149 family rSAM-modified RiPP [Bacteroidales bacterium]|jgi:natural product precursor|nr:TIGR04149 family rSAM-modified RiPP [Bacteroidales bacterium]
MEKIELTKEELNELIGGQRAEVLQPADIINDNSTVGCTCNYNNSSAVENRNAADGCICRCK